MVDAGSISIYNKGHVSGAINVDWTRDLENRVFKNKESYQKIIQKFQRTHKLKHFVRVDIDCQCIFGLKDFRLQECKDVFRIVG